MSIWQIGVRGGMVTAMTNYSPVRLGVPSAQGEC